MPEDAPEPFSIDILIEAEGWTANLKEPQIFCQKIISHTLKGFESAIGDVDVLLCNNEKMRELNSLWRKIDKPTNVLSFGYNGNENALGSIALGFEVCKSEAIDQDKPFEDHVSHLLVHGVLHLLGYDHENEKDADEMEALEIEILAELGIANPYRSELIIGQIS